MKPKRRIALAVGASLIAVPAAVLTVPVNNDWTISNAVQPPAWPLELQGVIF